MRKVKRFYELSDSLKLNFSHFHYLQCATESLRSYDKTKALHLFVTDITGPMYFLDFKRLVTFCKTIIHTG